ncbi:MAG TPA: hypothetical protein VJT72_08955 [Pseudonocardiaceae bacterium]|nr:hypothetical protein [Pseudonocardiaceae bacterium]
MELSGSDSTVADMEAHERGGRWSSKDLHPTPGTLYEQGAFVLSVDSEYGEDVGGAAGWV